MSSAATTSALPRAAPDLGAAHFVRVAVNGFGDGHNSYPWGGTWFDGRLYIGTARDMLVMVARRFGYHLPMPFWPVPVPQDDRDVDLRGQLWCFDPDDGAWTRVYHSPLADGVDGRPTPLCCGFRNLAVFRGASDARPVLYSIPGCGSYGRGPVVLRSENGHRFDVVSEPGLGVGDDSITSYRPLLSFKGRLFTSPSGSRGAKGNVAYSAIVLCSDDPAGGRWATSNVPAFGDPNNHGVFDLGRCGDFLYAGTINVRRGCQLWRTDAEGPPPHRWTKVAEDGFDRGPRNEMIMCFAEFRGDLYLGTGIQNGGHDRINNVGRDAGEVIRVHRDGTWDLVMGDPRMTRAGLKVPLSGQSSGFDNFFAGYIWRMTVHDDVLYVGTFDAACFLPYADPRDWPAWLRRTLDPHTLETFLELRGGGELWRSTDGAHWLPVTRNGFGNRFNYGVRSLVSTPRGLFACMANPFGPTVAVPAAQGWRYADNPDGGLEVWWGRSSPAPFEAPQVEGADRHSTRVADQARRARHERDPRVRLAGSSGLPAVPATQVEGEHAAYFGADGLRTAGFWQRSAGSPAQASLALVQELVDLLPVDAGPRVVAAGAAAPELARALASLRAGLDPRPVRWSGGLPADRGSADALVWVEGPERAGLTTALLEARRVLVPGGVLVAADLWGTPLDQPDQWRARATLGVRAVELERRLRAEGWCDVRVIDITHAGWDRFHQHSRSYFRDRRMLQLIDDELEKAVLGGLPGGGLLVEAHLLFSATTPLGNRP